MNPEKEKDSARLRTVIEQSYRKLKPFRENNIEAIRQYVGSHYSNDGADDKVPINLLELAINIYIRQLAARSPNVLVTTPYSGRIPGTMNLKPYAANLELATNHLIKEIKLGKTFMRVVRNALFCIGILKCGLGKSDKGIEVDGFWHDIGQPFANSISIDNWVHDMSAEILEKVQFAGDHYRLPFEYVKNSELYIKKARDKLTPTENTGRNPGGGERAESLSGGTGQNYEQYQPLVDLWDIWLPQENLVVTYPVYEDGSFGDCLRIVDWDGPEGGPYHFLLFNEVPDNVMPLAPVALWRDIHDLANRLFRKCGRQAERQKTITGVRTGAEKDGSRVLKASDGDMIGLDDPKSTQEYKYGGVDPQTLAFLIQTKDLASYMWGNLDALGGLSPQADTLGQDQLLTANASKRIEDMQDRTVEFVKDITTDLAWYLFTDPLIEMPLVKRVPGTDIEIPTAFRAEDREGDFLDYNFDIEPYSMQHQSPGMRIQTLMEIFERLLAPAMPMLEAQGITINFEAFLQTISKYRNMPELQDILIFSGPPQSYGEGPVGQPPKQSPVTTRRYERVNRPGATRSGKDHVLMQALLGQASQPAEAATLTRAVG